MKFVKSNPTMYFMNTRVQYLNTTAVVLKYTINDYHVLVYLYSLLSYDLLNYL